MQVIVPGRAERYALRLVAYAPNGARLGTLPHHLGFEVGTPLNDVPSLKLSYPAAGVGSDWLATPVEIAVEYAVDGGQWVEPDGGRFLLIKRGSDSTDQSGARTFELPGWAWQLRKLVMYAGGVMVEGKRLFSAVTPGALLRTLVQEAQARGAVPGLSIDFTSTHDSAPGTPQPWDVNKLLTLELEPGIDLLTLLINLSEQGVLDWTMSGRTLRVYREGTTLGRQLGTGGSPVELRLGRDIDEAPDSATLEDFATAILIRGEKGLAVEVTNPSAVAPWGRWEATQSQGGVSDQGTAILLGQNALERASRERAQLTRGIRFEAARFLPFARYRPGDFIKAPGDGGQMQVLRVRQITLSVDGDGALSGNLVLNDRFLEREIKLARQAAGILAGGIGSGGTGSTPAPEPGGRAPAKPQGLIVNAAAFIDETGTARGQITATWSPVIADPAGVAIEVDAYELYARENNAGGIWHQIAVTEGATASYSPLRVGVEYAFKVRAVADVVRGEFSDQTILLVPDDTTPPPVPSTPALMSRLGVIHVSWDGLGSAGESMPLDFDRVLVWMKAPADPGSTLVDYLQGAGVVVIGDQPYGADREIWLTAVDRSGNESAPSGVMTIATAPLVDTDVIGEVISGANIVDGSITASDKIVGNSITAGLIQALAIQAGHIAANAVTADKIEAGAVNASKLTATAIDGKTITGAILRTSESNPRVQIGSGGLEAFNSVGLRTVHINSSTGQFSMQTAAAGARVHLDVAGLRAYNSSGVLTTQLNASTGEFDVVGRIRSGISGPRLVINPNYGVDPEIRFYENETEYHYITSWVSGDNALQMGSVIANDRKGLVTLSGDGVDLLVTNGAGTSAVAGLRIRESTGISFTGKIGTTANGAITRGFASFPANALGSIGYGFTFSGTAVVVTTMFNIFGPHAVSVNSRNNSGFGFDTYPSPPGAAYDVMFWAWNQ
ncbi:fibronectin type III domain-containing protein [Nonomuraea sp. NPDC049784]|uniref:fibronectin type III domain-containing protein n=1 Tax=Nonomuraea sp. NPDC049784 TaxID=3154361 RepID=UPI0034074B7F